MDPARRGRGGRGHPLTAGTLGGVRRVSVLLALALAACSNGASPRPRPTPSTPTPTPTSAALPVLAVHDGGGITLYRATAKHGLTWVAALDPPAYGDEAKSVTLSAGDAPDACVVWLRGMDDDDKAVRTVVCYPYGSTAGRAVAGITGRPTSVALRPDGRALAWLTTSGSPSYQIDVVVGDRDGDAVTNVRRIVPDPKRPPGKEGCCMILKGPESLAWSGDALLLSIEGQDDEGGGLALMPLDPASVARGWIAGARPIAVPRNAQGYAYYDTVVAADRRTALAVERGQGFFDEDQRVHGRAVRIDLATARVVEVVATPATGRAVTEVSGGARGIAYTTEAVFGGPTTYYLRLPGEAHGTPLRGLPVTTSGAVLAQP